MKQILDMRLTGKTEMGSSALLKYAPVGGPLPEGIRPGQFAEVEAKESKNTFLRRPISVCMADYSAGELWLLVRRAGDGTRCIADAEPGAVFSMVLPLGNGFSVPECAGTVLLAGGGVGVAPLLYHGQELSRQGFRVEFAIGARTAADLMLVPQMERIGKVHIATEDGSAGLKGFVTHLPVFESDVDHIACCGPTPMMKAVAGIAKARGINCEVSLENMMACGLGACLCCVEDTKDGHLCVCADGPVFNINDLKWQI